MFYVTTELLKQLPEEARKIIETEGLTQEDLAAMPEKEREALMAPQEAGESGHGEIKAPDQNEDAEPTMDQDAKVDDSMKLPKAMKYGAENEFEDSLTADGRMAELPESKKNEIDDFQSAQERGVSLLDKMAEEKPKRKDVQKELEK
jgi:hypothetical protein